MRADCILIHYVDTLSVQYNEITALGIARGGGDADADGEVLRACSEIVVEVRLHVDVEEEMLSKV